MKWWWDLPSHVKCFLKLQGAAIWEIPNQGCSTVSETLEQINLCPKFKSGETTDST